MFKVIPLRQTEQRNIKDWYYDKDQIDIDPSYQRMGDIWDNDMKQYFLDSIINGFDIPKFYFHYFPSTGNILSEKGMTYAVIDGKQRFKAILDFIEGKIDLGDSIQYYRDESINLRNLKYVELAREYPSIKADFDNFILDVVLVVTDEKDKIEELFARLNKGEPLNNAEKRNALGGYLVEEIRRIAQHDFWYRVSFRNTRYAYYDIIAKLLLIEHSDKIVSLSKRNLDSLVLSNKHENPQIRDTIYKVEKMLDFFCQIYEESLFVKSAIPVHYWFIRSNGMNPRIRDFLTEFNKIRIENRKVDDSEKSVILVEFDKLNQQGTISLRSLESRFKIMQRYFEVFLNNKELGLHTPINIDDLDELA